MKKGNLEHWENYDKYTNLLFFSQLVNELLFDYSIPSNRVSTLNSHYLCLDAMSAIEGIEKHGVPEGSLKPIMEELYSALKKDPIYSEKNNSPLDFFVKYQGDRYVFSSRVSDLNYEELKKTAEALHTYYFSESKYYDSLKESITDIVTNNKTDKQKELFRLVKSLLTELMNMGYSLSYIYEVMRKNYWAPKNNLTSAEDIKRFFDAFSLKDREYEVILKVNRKRMERFVQYIDGVDLVDTLNDRYHGHAEKNFLKKASKQAFILQKNKALDPFAAARNVKDIIVLNMGLFRLFDHEYRYDINTAKCGVYDDSHFYSIGQVIRSIEHTKPLSSKQIAESMRISNMAFESVVKNQSYYDVVSILNAARFHSHSLDSNSEENQLLDLWAIFETILDISNKHTSDRIQQVCKYLVPILKRRYIYSLFSQLTEDLKNYDEPFLKRITKGETDRHKKVQIICEFVLLENEEWDEERSNFLDRCNDFPLLKERIEYYGESLRTTKDVFEFVEKHGECVRWQIMRIYRNRNLIIHNGSTMPYLSLLIENLHSYVDEFLSYSIQTLSKGHDIDSMCQELFVKECQWNSTFQKNNRKMDTNLIEIMLEM